MNAPREIRVAGTGLMPSPLPARAYVDPEIFQLEQQAIFGSLWIFAGMAQLLEEENAFLTRMVGGRPVVIQRLEGELRAFENRCLHRQMPLQWEAVGNRRLLCKYHGWSYGPDGGVKGIVNPQIYEAGEKICELRLREFPVRQVGNLLFINVGERPNDFAEQFNSTFVEQLEAASSVFDSDVAHAVFDVPWNWKLNFENVLDWNHVQFVHPRSFLPLLDPDGNRKPEISANARALLEQMRANVVPQLADLSYGVHGPMVANIAAWADSVGRYGVLDDYYNWFIYPNVNFCSVHGRMFLLQQFVPKSPTVTEYHLSVLTAKRLDPRTDHSGLLWSLMKGEKSVIDEDAVPLSQLQAKLSAAAPRALHGAYEAHIVRMHRWYMNALGVDGSA